ILVSVLDSEGRRLPAENGSGDPAARFGFRRGTLASYVPGAGATILADGVARLVRAGSKLNFQIHYTPNGKAGDDTSCVGFKFGDPKAIRKLVHGGGSANSAFVIPPHTAGYAATSATTIPDDQLLLWMAPHMHNRGQAMKFEASYPDGTQ